MTKTKLKNQKTVKEINYDVIQEVSMLPGARFMSLELAGEMFTVNYEIDNMKVSVASEELSNIFYAMYHNRIKNHFMDRVTITKSQLKINEECT
jgi:hypothetical protein